MSAVSDLRPNLISNLPGLVCSSLTKVLTTLTQYEFAETDSGYG
jgi:hypothetical protein